MPKGTVRFPFLVMKNGKVFAKAIKAWYNIWCVLLWQQNYLKEEDYD